MLSKLLGRGLYGVQRWGGKVIILLALLSLVLTSPYWSQIGVKADETGFKPLPMQAIPEKSEAPVEAPVLASVADASAQFSDWDCPYKELFVREAKRVDMPWQLLSSVAFFESGYNPKAVSSAGARGLMQFMKSTWADVMGTSFDNAFDPEQSIIAGATYLQTLRGMWWNDNWSHDKIVAYMLSSYCAGPGNVKRNGINTIPAVVKTYVNNILNATGYKTYF